MDKEYLEKRGAKITYLDVDENGIVCLEELEKAGIQEGDTVRMYGFDFDYYK